MSSGRVLQWSLFIIVVAAYVTRAGTPTPASSPQPAAVVEVVAQAFENPIGVAVSRDGSIVVSDYKAGTITQVASDGQRTVLLSGLEGPAGVTFDQEGGLLIVEERGRRVLRRDPSGALAILASGIVSPRWIAVAPGGAVYLSAKQVVPVARGRTARDVDGENGGSRRILELLPSGGLRTVADGFQGLEGLVWGDGSLYAALRHMSTDRGPDHTWLVRIPIGADGTAGPPQAVLRGRGNAPTGIAVDRLGAVFVTTRSSDSDDDDDRGGAVLKRLASSQVASILTGVRKPQGIAFEAAGHLLVVEGRNHGRLLRLRAPAPPTITAPQFTNLTPFAVTGEAAPASLVQAFPANDFAHPLASAAADAGTGAFSVSVPLALNAETALSFTATASGGLGLTSGPAHHTIVHDNLAPIATILEPLSEVHVRDGVTLRGRGEDDGSGVDSIAFALDDPVVATFDNAAPTEPIEREAVIDTSAPVDEGPHTLTVTATDRAGNTGSAGRLIVVDRTPPVTQIVSGPSGETAETTVTFVVTGTDVYSPVLSFAWRLDKSAWTPFGPATTIILSNLTPGEHVFEVKARDLAGNENELNPAVQTFTVRSLRIRITEPVDGAVVATPSVWLRGTVEGGSDVTVTIPLPPGMLLAALPASVEAGTFAVEVPINPTTTTLTAIATDVMTGATASHTISVVAQPDSGVSTFGFTALPAAGLAPHLVSFSVNLGEGTRVALDQDSNGTVEFDGTTLEGLSFVYDQPGIYVATLRAITSDGEVLTYRAPVEVYDRTALDARLLVVWNGFKEALQGGDVARAVSFIHGNRRAAWKGYFGQLQPDALLDEATGFTTIELVQVGRGGAEYEMLREEDGRVFSYPIVFVADLDGRWRLWQF